MRQWIWVSIGSDNGLSPNVFVYDYDKSHVNLIYARGLYTYGRRHLVELYNIVITRWGLETL